MFSSSSLCLDVFMQESGVSAMNTGFPLPIATGIQEQIFWILAPVYRYNQTRNSESNCSVSTGLVM
jgi:hypothetical protein